MGCSPATCTAQHNRPPQCTTKQQCRFELQFSDGSLSGARKAVGKGSITYRGSICSNGNELCWVVMMAGRALFFCGEVCWYAAVLPAAARRRLFPASKVAQGYETCGWRGVHTSPAPKYEGYATSVMHIASPWSAAASSACAAANNHAQHQSVGNQPLPAQHHCGLCNRNCKLRAIAPLIFITIIYRHLLHLTSALTIGLSMCTQVRHLT